MCRFSPAPHGRCHDSCLHAFGRADSTGQVHTWLVLSGTQTNKEKGDVMLGDRLDNTETVEVEVNVPLDPTRLTDRAYWPDPEPPEKAAK